MKRFAALLLCLCFLAVPVQAAEEEKLVALTFDDGPSGRFTRRLLEGLAEREVKATFLLCGYRIEIYPELTQRIFQEGHEIGLHGFSHKSMGEMCAAEITRELEQTMALLPEGCSPVFLRAPGGLCGKCVKEAAADVELAVLYWSVDPKDWATNDAAAIQREVLEHVRDGDVILLHDMSDSSVDATLAIVEELLARGYRFVTVSELARARNITPEPGQVYTRFGSQDG